MTRRHDELNYEYFQWLCDMVHIEQERTSWKLVAKDLHRMIFVPLIERDENRALDGLDLRDQFIESEWYNQRDEIEGECTVFEMLVALAQRMDFETTGAYDENSMGSDRTAYWFWEMTDNLGLTAYDDDSYVDLDGTTYVEQIIDEFVNREYDYDGTGGIFPLKHAEKDQRNVEIWYQMSAYLYENE